jgi:hypothetical protein
MRFNFRPTASPDDCCLAEASRSAKPSRFARISTKQKSLIVLSVVALLVTGLLWWRQGAPRRESLATLTRLETALHSGSRAELVNLLVIPAAVRDRSAAEQSEFLSKALNHEISPEGLAALRRRGDYGRLKDLFPAEAEAWSKLAGVPVDDCVAFKLEGNGVRAEVVLLKPSNYESEVTHGKATYRIVRLNNVKQMTDGKSSTSERNP